MTTPTPTPPSLQYDACGALLALQLHNCQPVTLRCALGGPTHPGERHRSSDGTQWDTATPSRTISDVNELAAKFAELSALAAPSEGDALNLGPIIARHTAAIATSPSNPTDARASAADILPLVREVMRLRRNAVNVKAGEPSATARSAVAGLARQIEGMRHVFAELLAATCTGCTNAPSEDQEPQQDCPVHGEVAELRRSLAWAAGQHERIVLALGPEYTAPFGADAAQAAVNCIKTARGIDAALREASIEHPLGLRGVEDLAAQRDAHAEHVKNCEDALARIAELASDAIQARGGEDSLIGALGEIKAECARGDR